MALVSSRIGITPNMISVMSASITVLVATLSVYLGSNNLLAGMVLVLGLQLGYAFDCADGPLARAAGQGSSFGALSDKIADLSSGMLLPCILAYGAGSCHWIGCGKWGDCSLAVVSLFIAARATLCVLMWLKELTLYQADRLREDNRKRNLWWTLKKVVSLYIDEPIYRLSIAFAWSVGLFWEFLIVYGCGILFIAVLYIASSKREMDSWDKKAVESEPDCELP